MEPTLTLDISVDRQWVELSDGDRFIAGYPVSTAANGVGCEEGSLRTPTGRFRIVGKIGDGQPPGTIFRNRVPVGLWTPPDDSADDLVLTRILLLAGEDAANANTLARCIYLHGTNREDLIGQPVSHGCIRLRNADMLELFDLVPEGIPVHIHPPSAIPIAPPPHPL